MYLEEQTSGNSSSLSFRLRSIRAVDLLVCLRVIVSKTCVRIVGWKTD